MDGTVSQQSINSIFLWSYSSDLQLEKILMDQIGIPSQMLYQLSHLILVIKSDYHLRWTLNSELTHPRNF